MASLQFRDEDGLLSVFPADSVASYHRKNFHLTWNARVKQVSAVILNLCFAHL